MGQAASMCRFRGCRYKKNKTAKSSSSSASASVSAAASSTAVATNSHNNNNNSNSNNNNNNNNNNINNNSINNATNLASALPTSPPSSPTLSCPMLLPFAYDVHDVTSTATTTTIVTTIATATATTTLTTPATLATSATSSSSAATTCISLSSSMPPQMAMAMATTATTTTITPTKAGRTKSLSLTIPTATAATATSAPATPSYTETTVVAASTTTSALAMQSSASGIASGLHLRSIEEPYAQTSIGSTQQHSRMPTEQGGTGYGSDSVSGISGCWLGSRIGVPLPAHMHNAHSPLSPTQKGYDAEYARMEAWMDENQEFVQDYFIRKATRHVVDAWLVSHATSSGNDVNSGSPTHGPNGQNCSSRGGSGATTPVRKISAHEFERGGLLKPIVNTIDGTPTFLSIGTQNDCSTNLSSSSGGSCSMNNTSNGNTNSGSGSSNNSSSSSNSNGVGVAGMGNSISTGNNNNNMNCSNSSSSSNYHHNGHYHHNHHHHHHNQQMGSGNGHHHHGYHSYRPQRLSRNELKQLDEKELIFELVKDICNELEVRTLCHKILQNVSILLNADRGSLFLVQGRCNGSDGLKKCLVSKLFDVCPRSTVEEMEQQEEVRVAWGSGIAGHVAESGEPVNIPDAYQDERFNCEIDTQTGYRTRALLCMPIKDSSGDVIGVAQVINKLNGERFTEIDEKVFASYLQFCGIGLRNAQLYEKSQLEIKRNQVLLDLARMIFEEQSTIEHMVFRILTHMQSLIQCQRVQILLVHEASKGSFSRVFDFEANDLSDEGTVSRTSPYESRFPINVGITGYVATTGETVNVPNAYEDDRFDPSVDESSGFKHKSILCMAIKNSLGQIIGVIQLVNKFEGLDFSKNDENFVEAFAIFCGMGIHNTHMYEKAIVAMAKQSVTLEVLSYHASATIDEANRLRRLGVPSAAHFRLHDFKFDDIHFQDDDTLKACLRMFLDLDFVNRFHIDYDVLCRWLLSVKKNYRNVTYHNWRHAFNVAQMMFAILTATQWWMIFGEIECLALIIGCLCHDLDHRGTNNSFQIKASSPLAQLYSTSTMEHHHFDQCLMILNSPGNQILGNLSSKDYCRVIHVLEDAILSTDLAVYFRKRGPFLDLVKEKPKNYWVDEEPRALLRAMSMTVCDLSAITKPWEIEKRVADLVSSEFFEQGDMEKQELNITPIDIMNREKENELPKMQVNFIESICLPIYEAFAHLSDELEPLVEGVRDNRQHWIEMADDVEQKSNDLTNSTLVNCNSSASNRDSPVSGGDLEDEDEEELVVKQNRITLSARSSEDRQDEDDVEQGVVNDFTANDDDDAVEVITESTILISEAHEVDLDDCNHSCSGQSSASSRLSTPPPTGEDDNDSEADSQTSTTEAVNLLADNLNCVSPKMILKPRGSVKSCDCARSSRFNHIRKTSSLNAANELQTASLAMMATQNGISRCCSGCSCHRSHSKSTPSIAGCGAGHHAYHQHHHQHQHNHQNHTGQHNHTALNNCGSTTLSGANNECDKIPKIVGKLGNLDSLQYFATAASTTGCADATLYHHATSNGIAFTANGHFNYVPLVARRHSETNGLSALPTATATAGIKPLANVTSPAAAIVTDK